MNKVILLLLVVCLVSVHAYVKRDAPATDNAQGNDFIKNAQKVMDDIAENINPESFKKAIGDALEKVNKVIADLNPTEAPKA